MAPRAAKASRARTLPVGRFMVGSSVSLRRQWRLAHWRQEVVSPPSLTSRSAPATALRGRCGNRRQVLRQQEHVLDGGIRLIVAELSRTLGAAGGYPWR